MNNQTPQKEDSVNRRTKDSRVKKSQKIVKKSLNAVFPSVCEDVSSDTTKESSDLSSISDANCCTPIAQRSELDSAASEAFSVYDITPACKIATSCDYDHKNASSLKHRKFDKVDYSVEVDIVSNFLKQARNQVLNTNDVDQQSKKLLDALLKTVLDDFYSLPEDRGCYAELVSAKFRILFLCFFIWSFLVSVIFIGLRSGSSYSGLPPT